VPNTFAPFGLRPVASLAGSHGNEVRQYPLPNGANCPDLARGSPVKLSGGVITSIGASGDGPLLGVATGFAWVDTVTKQPQIRSAIPADVSSGGLFEGFTTPVALVTDNPFTIFMIQANASVTAGDVGLNFNVTAVGGDVDVVYGVSRYSLAATSRTSAVGTAVKCVGIANMIDNSFADAFPIVLVKLNGPTLQNVSAN
jgi:hypothetical protein